MTRSYTAESIPDAWVSRGQRVTVDGVTGDLIATWGANGRMYLILIADGARRVVEVARDEVVEQVSAS